MKNRLKILFVGLGLCSASAMAQTLQPVVNDKGIWGYSDENGVIVIKHQYSTALAMQDGLALVEKGGKWGMIDAQGKIVLPIAYKEIAAPEQGIRRVNLGGKWGLIRTDGSVLVKPTYGYISRFNCYGKAWFNTKGPKKGTYVAGKTGVIDIQGKVLVEATHKHLGELSREDKLWGGIAPEVKIMSQYDTLKTNCDYMWFDDRIKTAVYSNFKPLYPYSPGIIDGSGKVLLPHTAPFRVWAPQTGMMRYIAYNKSTKGYDWHYVNTGTGQDVIVYRGTKPAKGEHVTNKVEAFDYVGELAFVGKEGRKDGYLVNRQGEIVINNISQTYEPYEDTFVAIDNNSLVALYSANGTAIFAPGRFKGAHWKVSNGLWGVEDSNGKWGYVNMKGEMVVPHQYEKIGFAEPDLYGYKQNGKWGVNRFDGTPLVPCQFEDYVYATCPDHLWVKDQGLFYNYNIATKQIDKSTEGYKTIYVSVDGLRYVATEQCVKDSTGYLVDDTGCRLFSKPVKQEQFNALRNYVIQLGRKPLNTQQGRVFLLNESKPKRMYKLDTKIPANDWDY